MNWQVCFFKDDIHNHVKKCQLEKKIMRKYKHGRFKTRPEKISRQRQDKLGEGYGSFKNVTVYRLRR